MLGEARWREHMEPVREAAGWSRGACPASSRRGREVAPSTLRGTLRPRPRQGPAAPDSSH
ncbi:DUF3253 domain-containing protein [Myxococcus sp. RHST-1-4]|nr:DUF3253 domain-containing protein [Myxococcus sp. RHSTA-1-4]